MDVAHPKNLDSLKLGGLGLLRVLMTTKGGWSGKVKKVGMGEAADTLALISSFHSILPY